MFEIIIDKYNYWIAIVLMMIGLYLVLSQSNMVKKLIGLNIFQTSVFVFYISIGRIYGGTAPIYIKPKNLMDNDHTSSLASDVYSHVNAVAKTLKQANENIVDMAIQYTNPLPHVLILTAIVVGVATMAVGLSLVVRINEQFGSIEGEEVAKIELEDSRANYKENKNLLHSPLPKRSSSAPKGLGL